MTGAGARARRALPRVVGRHRGRGLRRAGRAPLRATLPQPRPAAGSRGAPGRSCAGRGGRDPDLSPGGRGRELCVVERGRARSPSGATAAARSPRAGVPGSVPPRGGPVAATVLPRGAGACPRPSVRAGGTCPRPVVASVARDALCRTGGRVPAWRAGRRVPAWRAGGRAMRLEASPGRRGRAMRPGLSSSRRGRGVRPLVPSPRRGRALVARSPLRPSGLGRARPTLSPLGRRSPSRRGRLSPSPRGRLSPGGGPPLPARSPPKPPGARGLPAPARLELRLGAPLPSGAPRRARSVVGRPLRGPSGRRGRPEAASLGTRRVYRPLSVPSAAAREGRRTLTSRPIPTPRCGMAKAQRTWVDSGVAMAIAVSVVMAALALAACGGSSTSGASRSRKPQSGRDRHLGRGPRYPTRLHLPLHEPRLFHGGQHQPVPIPHVPAAVLVRPGRATDVQPLVCRSPRTPSTPTRTPPSW